MLRRSLPLVIGLLALPACLSFAPGASLGLRSSPLAAQCSTRAQARHAGGRITMAEQVDRRDAGKMIGALAGIWLAGSVPAFAADASAAAGTSGTLEGGLEYKVLQAGKGPKPKIGDLVAIRFSATFNGRTFDDCFKTQNAYYFRVGSESVIKGLDLAVQNMRVGDKWDLKVPPALAFGEKGVKASAGKPKIPGGSTIEYTVLLETFPGAEEELLEVTNGEVP